MIRAAEGAHAAVQALPEPAPAPAASVQHVVNMLNDLATSSDRFSERYDVPTVSGQFYNGQAVAFTSAANLVKDLLG